MRDEGQEEREVKKMEVKLGGRRVERRKKWRWREEGDKSKEGVRNNKKNQTKVRWKRSAASGEGIIVRKWLDLVHLIKTV